MSAPLSRPRPRKLLDAMPREGTVDSSRPLPVPCRCGSCASSSTFRKSLDETVARWSASLIRIGDILMTPDQKSEALEALTEFKAFLREHVAARRARPGDSLMDLAIRAHDDGTLDEEETLTNLVSMLVAGHETTVTLIGNGLLLLLRHPGEMARLRADRACCAPPSRSSCAWSLAAT